MDDNAPRGITEELKAQAVTLLGLLGFMWVLEFLDQVVFQGRLNAFGIRPGSGSGLLGILFAPFLHANFGHLIANTLPFLILGWLVMLREISDFIVVTVVTTLVSGFGVWLFGAPNTIHLGASGLIFGYLGYLLLRGYFERSLVSILFSVVVALLYGGLVWGVLPLQVGVSWQAHLFGFIGGGLAARLLARPRRGR
jgi:membrane associated rhomboid family serine protease